MSNDVNPILLGPLLRTELAIDMGSQRVGHKGATNTIGSAQLKVECLTSWLQSGLRAVHFFPLVTVTVSIQRPRNVYQRLKESVALLS